MEMSTVGLCNPSKLLLEYLASTLASTRVSTHLELEYLIFYVK